MNKKQKLFVGVLAALLAIGLYVGFTSDSTLFTGFLAVETREVDGQDKSIRQFLDSVTNADTYSQINNDYDSENFAYYKTDVNIATRNPNDPLLKLHPSINYSFEFDNNIHVLNIDSKNSYDQDKQSYIARFVPHLTNTSHTSHIIGDIFGIKFNAPYEIKNYNYILPVLSGPFFDYFTTESNDWYSVEGEIPAGGVSTSQVAEAINGLYEDRKNEAHNRIVDLFLQKINDNTFTDNNTQDKPFNQFELDKNIQNISYYTYEDLQKLHLINMQIASTILPTIGTVSSPVTQLIREATNYNYQNINIEDETRNHSIDVLFAAEDLTEIEQAELKHEYVYVDINEESINGVNSENIAVGSEGMQEKVIIDNSNGGENPLITDYLDPTPFSYTFTTDQNTVDVVTHIIELNEGAELELPQTYSTDELNSPEALGAGQLLVNKIVQTDVNGLSPVTVTWDKNCLQAGGLFDTCDTAKNLALITLIKSKVSDSDSNFIERITEDISIVVSILSNGVSETNQIAQEINFNDISFLPPAVLENNQYTLQTGQAQTALVPIPAEEILPEVPNTISLNLKNESSTNTLDCTNALDRLVCTGTPTTSGEFNIYLKIREDESLIGNENLTVLIEGQNIDEDPNNGGNTGNTGSGSSTPANIEVGNAIQNTTTQTSENATAGQNSTVTVELTQAQKTAIGITNQSTVHIRVTSEDGTETVIECDQTNSGLDCNGEIPTSGNHTIEVIVSNTNPAGDTTSTSHELTGQSVEIAEPVFEFSNSQSNNQQVSLHNPTITVTGTTLDAADTNKFNLVRTQSAPFGDSTYTPTAVTENSTNTIATLQFADVMPGTYNLKYGEAGSLEDIVTNIRVLDPIITNPAESGITTEFPIDPVISFENMFTLANGYKIEVTTQENGATQTITEDNISGNNSDATISYALLVNLERNKRYTVRILPKNEQGTPIEGIYAEKQFQTLSNTAVTQEDFTAVPIQCDSDVFTESTTNCEFTLPIGANLPAGAVLRFQGQQTGGAIQTVEGARVGASNITTPATAGTYTLEITYTDSDGQTVVLANNSQITVRELGDADTDPETDPEVDPEDGETNVVDASDLIDISRQRRVQQGESLDIELKFADDLEFQFLVASLYKELDDDEYENAGTLFYHCQEDIEDKYDIDYCPEYEDDLFDKEEINIKYNTSNAAAGDYLVSIYGIDQEGNVLNLSKRVEIKSSQFLPGAPNPGVGQLSGCTQYFADMSPQDPQCYDTTYLYQLGLFQPTYINGMPVASLQQPIKRAEMFMILGQLYGYPQNYIDVSPLAGYYTDITQDMVYNQQYLGWLTPLYYLTAYQKVSGFQDGTVRPGQTPIMAELAKSIGEATGFIYYTPSTGGKWYDSIVNTYYSYGITFNPEAPVTRRGAVYLLSRTLQIIQNPGSMRVSNPLQARGFEYSSAYQQTQTTGFQGGGYATNPYGVGSYNQQNPAYYTNQGYQGLGGYGSYGSSQNLGLGAYGYNPYGQYQQSGY